MGLFRFPDVVAFRLYYRLFLAAKDSQKEADIINDMCDKYPEVPSDVPVLRVHSPNSREVESFLKEARPNFVLARCKSLLKKEIFDIRALGTYVLHPGVCPEYRNAHGCF